MIWYWKCSHIKLSIFLFILYIDGSIKNETFQASTDFYYAKEDRHFSEIFSTASLQLLSDGELPLKHLNVTDFHTMVQKQSDDVHKWWVLFKKVFNSKNSHKRNFMGYKIWSVMSWSSILLKYYSSFIVIIFVFNSFG